MRTKRRQLPQSETVLHLLSINHSIPTSNPPQPLLPSQPDISPPSPSPRTVRHKGASLLLPLPPKHARHRPSRRRVLEKKQASKPASKQTNKNGAFSLHQ